MNTHHSTSPGRPGLRSEETGARGQFPGEREASSQGRERGVVQAPSRTKVVHLGLDWKGHGFKRDGKDLMHGCVGEIEWREGGLGRDES